MKTKEMTPAKLAAMRDHVNAVKTVLRALGFVEHTPQHWTGFAVMAEPDSGGASVGERLQSGAWTNPLLYRATLEQAGYTVTPMPINDETTGRYSYSLWYVAPKATP